MATSGILTTNAPYEGRQYKLTWSATQSVESNSSIISWEWSAVGGSASWYAERTLKVVIAGQTVINKTNRIERYAGVISSGTITLPHNTDGSKSFSASIQAAVYYSTVNATGSSTFTLDNIPRKAMITAAPNFTDEENPTINYSNLGGNSVTSLQACISLTGSDTTVSYRDISKTGTSYTFNLTDAERAALIAATTTSKSRLVYFYLKTVIGGNTFYHSLGKTLTIANCEPTLSPTAEDVNTMTAAVTGNKNIMISGYSNAKVNTGAQTYKGATIVSQSISNGNKVVNGASGTINGVESGFFTAKVTDSRGYTVTKSLHKSFIGYIKPTCNLEVTAPTTAGVMTLKISGNYYNGTFNTNSNRLTVRYRYKANDGNYGSYKTATATISGNTYTVTVDVTGLNYLNSYTVQAHAYDVLEDAYSVEKKVKAIPIFDWSENDFNFNVPITVMGKDLDYPIEDGADGIWHWRKWKSGLVELWGKNPIDVQSTTALGAAFRSPYIEAVQYPFEIQNPHLWADFESPGQSAILWTCAEVTTTSTPSYYAVRFTSGQATGNINYYIRGVLPQ